MQAVEKYSARFPGITDPKRRTYAAMLSAMDDGIGRVLAELDAIGQRDNTLVIFHNDNGGPTTRNAVNGSRNTPLRGSKCERSGGHPGSPSDAMARNHRPGNHVPPPGNHL
ncbi:MAG: sulfatase-like hydrolase/transferase [Verrucomicrobiales bacterium]